jgi:hypothetical protein
MHFIAERVVIGALAWTVFIAGCNPGSASDGGSDGAMSPHDASAADLAVRNGDGGGCATAADCPAPPACLMATCALGVCHTGPAPAETACASGVCDGNGACVACVAPSDCAPTGTVCAQRTCQANACGVANATQGMACNDHGGIACTGSGFCSDAGKHCAAAGDCVSGVCQTDMTCAPPPSAAISMFIANPAQVIWPGTTTFMVATMYATECTIDQGVGSVACNGGTTAPVQMGGAQYRLTASGPGGTAQAVYFVTTPNCSGLTTASGACPAMQSFCERTAIDPSSSAQAADACAACFGVACQNVTGPNGGSAWVHGGTFFYYTNPGGNCTCPGQILDMNGRVLGQWAMTGC